MGLMGRATLGGTEHYAERFAELDPGHFRLCGGLVWSSIGIGTYLGEASDGVDELYVGSVFRAIASGCNVVDTAINYRFQRSERAVGRGLRLALERGFGREEIVVCSKGGFVSFDGCFPDDPFGWVEENLVGRGIVTREEVSGEGHCLAPMFLNYQVGRSLENLGVDCIDVFYIHNPETQLSELNEVRFYESLEMAFRMMESCVEDGRIGVYGVATWDGFLDNSGGGPLLQLERVVELARRAGGDGHHFRVVQMPLNLEMTDGLSVANQLVGGRMMTLLEAAGVLDVCVVASAPLLQGGLVRGLPVTLRQAMGGLGDDASRALQFVRSVPGVASVLVGMCREEHVVRNMELASLAVLSGDEFDVLFGER